MVVIGSSGTGKSVLIKNVIGLLAPDSGDIYIDDQNITKLDTKGKSYVRRKFGMLFQGAALFDSLSVYENVAFPLKEHLRLTAEEIRRKVLEKLELVGLKNMKDVMPSELSGGVKKRVGLARALAMEPEIMLYDEPTTGLDPITGDVINKLIVEMQRKLNMTSITITHDMASAYRIAHRIAMLNQGKIIQVGTPEALKNTDNLIVKRFIEGRYEKQEK